jgi:hypothetical protein
MGSFTPSTLPGCRAPHFWLNDGTSLYDLLGNGYSLLRFDQSIDVQAFLQDSAAQNIPLNLIDLHDQDQKPSAYQHPLVLCRTDQHVVWRGHELPLSVAKFVSFLKGIASSEN